jgi:hypothetical protein
MSLQVVPQASAIVPSVADAEAVAIMENHVNMAKFLSKNDDGYQKISDYLTIMLREAQDKINNRWEMEERRKNGMTF